MASPRVKVRPAVQDYLQACEHLLSIVAVTHPPLSEDELRIVSHYATQWAKMVAQRAKI
ncbi:MAG: hypothetical protein HXY51_08710 [Nitrospirae bacterium]|nr:hypothetical protein [Nitrospirota bacterium]